MSIRVITRVWDDSPYEGTKLLIHLAMADHANDEGWFFLAQTTLAKKARCSVEYVRQTVRQMITDEQLAIERKGSSKGRATEYRLLPKRVVESPKVVTESDSPTLTDPLPNSDLLTPQLCSVPTVLYNRPNTTEVEPAAPTLTAGQVAADEWWREQSPRPIGKNAWFALLSVCKAAEERGYTKEQILAALRSINAVPSIQQMDKVLRNVRPSSARQERLNRGIELVNQLATTNPWEIES